MRALETVLAEKGYIDPAALDLIVETYEKKIGPRNGTRSSRGLGLDAEFKRALLKDATAAIASFGQVGRVGDHLVAVENTPQLHNIVVCTLCSCYPIDLLGTPPIWYKSAPYRSRAVRDPRGVLADFGVALPSDTEIRVWDSTAETRFLVLPMRPSGTEGWDEERLAALVTRDSHDWNRAGEAPGGRRSMNGVHDMGGMDGFGKVEPEANEPVFHAPWEGRVIAMMRAMGAAGAWNLDMFRATRERQPPAVYLASSYYKSWALAVETLALERGFVAPDELTAGHALHPGEVPAARGVARAERGDGGVRGTYERPATIAGALQDWRRASWRRTSILRRTRAFPGTPADIAAVIERLLGCQVFPDSSARGDGDDPQWLYTVVFTGRELWGADAEATLKVSIDAFEPYLEPA